MSGTDYYVDGLDKLEKALAQMVERDFPTEFQSMVIQIAQETADRAKQRTPRETGYLQDHWKIGKVVKRGDEYFIEVINDAEYAEPVEYGHRTTGGNGFVPGVHMLELALQEVSERLPGYLKDWLSEFLETHEL